MRLIETNLIKLFSIIPGWPSRCSRRILGPRCLLAALPPLSPPDQSQQQGDDCQNDQNMDQARSAVYKKAKYPPDNQYYCDKI